MSSFKLTVVYKLAFVSLLFLVATAWAEAATLSLSPSTGVYSSGDTFTARVQVNPQGQTINAAEGSLSFNSSELSVVSVSTAGSIFNLWVTEPTFSNSAGTINFSGGSPAGYSGSTGNIMSVTFRSKGSGSSRVRFTNGSVLANDGRGTNILSGMNGGNYTIQAAQSDPEPEEIEYVAPANTPAAPQVESETHPDSTGWHSSNEAVLEWTVPSDVTAVRTLLNENPSSIPTKVYEDPISTLTLSDLPEGESYLHVQFRNTDGWGEVTHYRLGVDTVSPENMEVTQPEDVDLSKPEQTLLVNIEDETSLVRRFKVKIDSNEPFEYIDETGSSTIPLPSLEPGYHTVVIEAFDQAGNSEIGSYSFTIESFAPPVFTEYPDQINEEVIPVIKGETRPNATVDISVARVGSEPSVYSINSDGEGEFIFIPEGTFRSGVYELTAQATDEFGAKSQPSEQIKIAVQQPGYIQIGSLIVSVLSVLIPLLALVVGLVLGVWYLLLLARRFRKKVRTESTEALEILRREFNTLQTTLDDQETKMQKSRKTKKLTKAETGMIGAMKEALQTSERKVEKEIEDITDLTDQKEE